MWDVCYFSWCCTRCISMSEEITLTEYLERVATALESIAEDLSWVCDNIARTEQEEEDERY